MKSKTIPVGDRNNSSPPLYVNYNTYYKLKGLADAMFRDVNELADELLEKGVKNYQLPIPF